MFHIFSICSLAAQKLFNLRKMIYLYILQGDAGSPMVRHINNAYGIASVVNIHTQNHPIVFIRLQLYKTYIENLKKKFKCEQPDKLSQSERRKQMKKIGEIQADNECKKGLRDPDERSINIPDLNHILDFEEGEGSTLS